MVEKKNLERERERERDGKKSRRYVDRRRCIGNNSSFFRI